LDVWAGRGFEEALRRVEGFEQSHFRPRYISILGSGKRRGKEN